MNSHAIEIQTGSRGRGSHELFFTNKYNFCHFGKKKLKYMQVATCLGDVVNTGTLQTKVMWSLVLCDSECIQLLHLLLVFYLFPTFLPDWGPKVAFHTVPPLLHLILTTVTLWGQFELRDYDGPKVEWGIQTWLSQVTRWLCNTSPHWLVIVLLKANCQHPSLLTSTVLSKWDWCSNAAMWPETRSMPEYSWEKGVAKALGFPGISCSKFGESQAASTR